jgi:hypothetical protein
LDIPLVRYSRGGKIATMQNARFWASLEMSQNGSDMDSTSIGFSHFRYSDHLGDWRRYNWAGMVVIVGQSGFW